MAVSHRVGPPKQPTATDADTGPRLNIETVFSRYGDSHVKDKTVVESVSS